MNYGLVQPTTERLPGGIGQASLDSLHPPGVVIYFTVHDLDAAIEHAERLGGTTVVPAWGIPGLGRMAVLTGPRRHPNRPLAHLIHTEGSDPAAPSR